MCATYGTALQNTHSKHLPHMQKILLFIFLFGAFSSFSQQKQVLFLNENNQSISKKEYRKGEKDNSAFLHIQHETDSSLEFRIVRRDNRGKLSRENLRLIRTGLEATAQVSIDSNQILVIDYYPGKDMCNSSSSQTPTYLRKRYREYIKELYGIAPLQQFNIYSDSSGLSRYYGVVPWYADLNDQIKKTFFPYHYPCGSFVVIYPSGFYHAYFGEYSTRQVFEAVRAETRKE